MRFLIAYSLFCLLLPVLALFTAAGGLFLPPLVLVLLTLIVMVGGFRRARRALRSS